MLLEIDIAEIVIKTNGIVKIGIYLILLLIFLPNLTVINILGIKKNSENITLMRII